MIRIIYKIDDEEEVKRFLNNLAPYLINKVRPFLFMVSEKDKIRSETAAAISQMLTKSKAASSPTPRTLEVLVSGDIMEIDQTNVTINIDDTNPFESLEQPKSHVENIEDQLKLIEEEKRLLEEEKRKIEEAKKKLLKDEMKRRVEEEKKRKLEEEEKKRIEEEKREKERKEKEEKEKEKKERRVKEAAKKKQREDESKPSSSSTPLSLASLTSNDDDQTDLISSLSKLIQKNKTMKSLQRTLMEVTNRLHSTKLF